MFSMNENDLLLCCCQLLASEKQIYFFALIEMPIRRPWMTDTAAARAQMDNPELSAEDVARKAMKIASEMCIYTNDNFTMESLAMEEEKKTDVKIDN